ncbi:MAG: hypothetical protein DRJ10_18175 [Bacteroidetes bacterium]|nr:MAG: hypothetical protein DRJ10_18175 [Bacteroidota bacterium]
MAKITAKGIIIWVIIVIIYISSFVFLSVYEFQDWKYGSFIESLIAVFQGAGVIAIITAVILLFQSQLEAQKEKGQKVFNEKISLYKEAIEVVENIFKDNRIESGELQRLEFIILKLQLISSDSTIRKFVEFYQKIVDVADIDLIQENNFTKSADLKRAFSEFIGKCRVELQLSENELDKSIFQQIQETVENSDKKKWQKSNYKDWDNYEEFLKEETNVSTPTINLIKKIHDDIINEYSIPQKATVNYTKTMISFLVHNAPSSRKRFLMITSFSANKFALSPSKDKNEVAPDGTTTVASWTDSYSIEIKGSTDYNDKAKHLIEKSYEYIMNIKK